MSLLIKINVEIFPGFIFPSHAWNNTCIQIRANDRSHRRKKLQHERKIICAKNVCCRRHAHKTIGRLSTFATMQKILIVRKSLYKLFYTTLVFSRGFLDHDGNIATALYIAFVDRNDC